LGALAYLAAPAFGASIDTASIIASATAAPVAAKVLAKTTLAFPFVFHSLNGVRHLVSFFLLRIYMQEKRSADNFEIRFGIPESWLISRMYTGLVMLLWVPLLLVLYTWLPCKFNILVLSLYLVLL
jgi:succinate dehydrogenase/fumarate reductase cytochrome b subunit